MNLVGLHQKKESGDKSFNFRTKVLRFLDSSVGAQEFVGWMQTYYNYIRLSQGIGGLIPAQMANIPINLMGNRWETIIGRAVKSIKVFILQNLLECSTDNFGLVAKRNLTFLLYFLILDLSSPIATIKKG